MSELARVLLSIGVASVAARSDSVATAAVQPLERASMFEALLDDPVAEAVGEALFTMSFFVGLWAVGKSLGWKFFAKGGKSKKPAFKTVPKSQPEPRALSVEKTPKQAAPQTKAGEARGTEAPPPHSQLRARQGKNVAPTETDLLAAAVRSGKAAELPRLIDASHARLSRSPGSSELTYALMETLFVACLRACAAKRCFTEALALYSHVECRIGKACSSTWSLLLWSAVEAGRFELCGNFLERLLASGSPTSYDFVNVVRYFAHIGDENGFAAAMRRIQACGCQIDVFARNRALSLCTGSPSFGLAQRIVKLVPNVPMDAIAYNTMMKGFANSGDLVQCFGQYAEMRRAQIMPTEMTFGILLDACIDDQQLDHARRVFSDLRDSGLDLNVILYTTFIKGLVNAGELTEAMGILDEMCNNRSAKPDLVTFSTLVKAHASVGNVMDCARLLERMQTMGIQPDSVLFNTILTGCCYRAMDPEQVLHVFSWLVGKGLQPSTATISVLIKAFSLSKSWKHALDVLEATPTRYGIWPEARVYGQLAQSCAKESCGADALAAYIAMVRAAGKQGISIKSSHRASHATRLQRVCAQCGQGQRASRITQALSESEGRVNQRVRDVLDACEAEARV